MLIKILPFLWFLFCAVTLSAQKNFKAPFRNCKVEGSTVVYAYNQKKWIFTDSADAINPSLPASTFKIINFLIALETGVIKDENTLVKWPGYMDTALYGYRPEIYRDMSVKTAFEVSAVWVFLELAKQIGKDRYHYYLKKSDYGNIDLSQPGIDFWNIGSFAISPVNQVNFLIKMYKHELPFSERNIEIVQRTMISENKNGVLFRTKTGYTIQEGVHIGWWVGYVTTRNEMYFFATRIRRKHKKYNAIFADCRKRITYEVLSMISPADFAAPPDRY